MSFESESPFAPPKEVVKPLTIEAAYADQLGEEVDDIDNMKAINHGQPRAEQAGPKLISEVPVSYSTEPAEARSERPLITGMPEALKPQSPSTEIDENAHRYTPAELQELRRAARAKEISDKRAAVMAHFDIVPYYPLKTGDRQ